MLRLVCAGLRWTGIGTVVGGVTAVFFFTLPWTLIVAFEAILLAFTVIGLIAETDHQKKLSAKVVSEPINTWDGWPGPDPRRSSTPQLEMPANYFMPYCVCPYCRVEALHWIEDAQLDVNDDKLMYRTGVMAEAEERSGSGIWASLGVPRPLPNYDMYHKMGLTPEEIEKACKAHRERENQRYIDKGREYAKKKNAERHVTRTCRECNKPWDQRIGWEAWW